MIQFRARLALAAMIFVFWSGPSLSEQAPPLGWFHLPSQSTTPAVVTGTPVPVLTAPAGSSGLIAEEGEEFEIVKLKYADVSEIVGLLTGSQTIKSNDDFSPQEPNFGSSSTSATGYFGSGGLPATPILSAPNGIVISNDSVGQAVDG